LDVCQRAEKYLENAARVLHDIEGELSPEYSRLLEAAKLYIEDADYYLSRGDCETALAAVSYAEGLIDSLKYLGILEPQWPSSKDIDKPVVFVAGTFDLIHPGHIELLKYAASMGKVYVVIARDTTVERLKGRKPILNERSRLRVIESIRYVYKARLGDERDMLAPLEEIKPDIIVLGPDQPYDEDTLASKVEERTGKRPKVVRFPVKGEFERRMSSSSDIIKRICCESYCHSIGCTRS